MPNISEKERKKRKKRDSSGLSLGRRIRQLRGELTQVEFAESIGVKQAMISRYESDKETPSPYNLLTITQATDKSIEWLLTGTETEKLRVKASKANKKKVTFLMTRDDHVEAMEELLLNTHTPEAVAFIEMARDLFNDRGHRKKVLCYYRFLISEEKAPKGKK